jgi:putative SOS response-associated peptidase YedK
VCGRFVSTSTADRIAEFFGASLDAVPLPANHNVAPTNDIYAVLGTPDGPPRLSVVHWGLVPSWAKDVKVGQRMINARAETLAEKPAFKPLFASRRCIVPMDGFYEWRPGSPDGPRTKAGKPAKLPVYVRRHDGAPLAVAGLWAAWRDPDADPDAPWLHSATVITTSANGTMRPIHDRMPVILPAETWEEWLDPANRDREHLQRLLVPAPDDLLVTTEVSTLVNDVRNKGPELLEPRTDPAG